MVFENRVSWHCQEQPPQNYIHLTEESKKMLLVTEWISFKIILWEFVDLAIQKSPNLKISHGSAAQPTDDSKMKIIRRDREPNSLACW